ncbi:hypothetical protein NFI96_007226 [Prochilodus magdalenae]|nr:hypothetical protein NFI96_007226 [Prochilodus magdalenae]
MCAWCQKVGVKRYSLSMGSELKSFCSEKCFAACRRAYFKRNKGWWDDEKVSQCIIMASILSDCGTEEFVQAALNLTGSFTECGAALAVAGVRSV